MRLRSCLFAIILAITLGAPIAEMFDTWDAPIAQGSDDTEANAVVAALCVGLGFALADFVVRCVRAHWVRQAMTVHPSALALLTSSDASRSVAGPIRHAPTPLRV